MAKDKYEFIQDLIENKKISPAQKERVLLLAKEEIQKDGILGRDLEERVMKLEEIIGIEGENPKDQNELHHPKDKNSSYIKHDLVLVYKLLSSFKFNDSEFVFKYLVHGYEISNIEEYNNKIFKARNEFKGLKNIPFLLYKKLDALIYAYETYGKKVVEKTGKHPFESNETIKIEDSDLEKLKSIFGGGSPYKKNHFNKFNTAIQNFKKEYRFDLENSESSILENYLRNITEYQDHKYLEEVYSFKDNDTSSLFNKTQVEFDLLVKSFFAWNPPLKAMIKWIIDGILKHSNIEGNRKFDPNNKKIKFSTYEEFDEISGLEYIVLEIIDTNSKVLRNPNEFTKNVWDAVNESSLTSVCDFEVNFTDINNKHYTCSLLPKNTQPLEITIGKNGLQYRFKFIKEIL